MVKKKQQIEIISSSARQTAKIASDIGGKLKKGDILALSGELGSGKTCFTAGLAEGLGIGAQYKVASPTFTLINEYPGRCKLYHFDVYRLNRPEELEELGYEEIFYGDGVVVIEWAEKIEKILPDDVIWIKFEYIEENERKIIISGAAQKMDELAREVKTEVG